MTDRSQLPVVAMLGDSRAFDTYYANAEYPVSALYGCDATFSHILRGAELAASPPTYDVVQIPDHFRGGSVQSNSLRLALNDPAVCILLDGIWETLLNKRHFLEWVETELHGHPSHSAEQLDFRYSSQRLADLFVSGALSISPVRYAGRQRQLISYFRRRRRSVIWMSLPVPSPDHLGGLHYAGHYQCIPEWGACLAAVNDAVRPIVDAFGARWMDLHELMEAGGGAGACLIDQWHFSRSFHALIAIQLRKILHKELPRVVLPADHVSRRFMLARPPGDTPLALVGDIDAARDWQARHPGAKVDAVLGLDDGQASSTVVVLFAGEDEREDLAARMLADMNLDAILLFPEELEPMRNPVGNERAGFADRNLKA